MEYASYQHELEKNMMVQTIIPISTPPSISSASPIEYERSICYTEKTLIHHFLGRVTIKDSEPAIAYHNITLTYAEVDKYSLRFARLLILRGFRKEQIILCRFSKSPWAIVAFLGILRAGLAFVPVDPSHPPARTKHLAAETSAVLILESKSEQLAVGNIESWKIDSHYFQNIPEHPSVELPDVARGDLAYVYFTSGSTGRPKGVMVEHGAICTSLVAHGHRLGMSSTSRVLQATSYTFDPCLTEIFGTLIHGGCICIPQDLTHLGETINELEVNWAFFTPSTISLLHPDEVPTLQTVSVGGEPLTQDCIDTWASRVQLYNSYGPTEACVFCCIAQIGPTTPRSVIGYPVGCQAWIVDPSDHNKLTPPGGVGELLIEGDILARGYLNDAGNTAAAYITGVSWALPQTPSAPPRRFYKTGDLARLDCGGTISCLGRRDKQIKIRGQRVELGDIESNINQHAGGQVKNVFVELVKKKAVDCLVAFLVFRPSYSMSIEEEKWKLWRVDLLDKLSKTLPAYMVPSELVPLREIAVNSSGKADRAWLREWFEKTYSEGSPEILTDKPVSDVPHDAHGVFETEVARVLSLKPSALDVKRTFLELGGNSLIAIRLVSRLRKLNLHLTTKSVMKPISLSSLAALAKDTASEGNTALSLQDETLSNPAPDYLKELKSWAATQCGVDENSIESIQRCTPFQESLMPSLASQPCTYVGQYTCKLPADTDLGWFKSCWETAYEKFPILRSRFIISPTHGAMRVVASDLISWCEGEPERSKRRMANETMGMGTRLSVFALGDNGESRDFILTLHHLLYDEWSLQLCLEYVAQLYARLPAPTSGPSFDHFVRFSLESTKDKSSQAFWDSQLSSACVAQFPRLPFTNYSPKLSASRTVRVKHATSRTAISIQASLALAMGIQTGMNDICFGTVMSGRDANIPGIDEIVGPTLATVPVRLAFQPTETVSSFLDRVESQQECMRPHEHFGLQNIRKTSEAAALACEFQTMLVIQAPSPMGCAKKLFGTREEIEIRDSHALVLECTMAPEYLIMEARFDTAAISIVQCDRFLELWEHLLTQLTHVEGSMTLGTLDRIPEADRQTIALWNSHVPHQFPGLVHDHLTAWSAEQPDEIAIDSWDGKLTYRELDLITTKLASLLVSFNPSDIVPLHFPKGLALVISIFAVLKAGRAFVCLDIEAPADRLTQVLEQLERPLVLSHNAKSTHALASVDCWTIDKAYLTQLTSEPMRNGALPSVSPQDTAYMIMTSGSTGRPKGVLVGHGGIMTTVDQSGPAWGIKKSSRMIQFVSVAFDAAIMEILSAVVYGACLCIPQQGVDLDVLARFVQEKKVNWAFFTPSFLRLVSPSELPGLETVVSGGEAMTTEVARIWASKVHLVNAYGPCECAITCASTPVQLDSLNFSSIGKAIGCALWVVEAQDHDYLAPIGTVGELIIEGAIVGHGYLNDDIKTAAAFISPPHWTAKFPGRDFGKMYKTGDLVRYDDNGNILYVGRKDNQVKLRGQRLELGEVEHNVQAGASSRPALCFVPSKGPFAKRLVAILGGRSNNLVPLSEYYPIPLELDDRVRQDIQIARDHVARKVPAYMVPEKFAVLRDLPVSLSGKLDRKAVATWIEQLTSKDEAFFSDGVESQELREDDTSLVTPAESMLRDVWAAVLGIAPNKLGINRSFQAMGGDSITAMQAIARSRNKGLDITMKEILRGDSIRVLASKSRPFGHLPSNHTHRGDDDSPQPLSAIQMAYSLLAPTHEKHHFNQSVQVQARRRISTHDLETAIRAVVTRHASLRTRYDFSDLTKPTQRVLQDAEKSYTVASSVVTSRVARVNRLKDIQTIPDAVHGPILHCELIEEEGGVDQRLFLVAPHLAVDIVSWRIILEDLETVLEGATLGPSPPVSYQDWCKNTKQSPVAMRDFPEPNYPYWGIDPASLVYQGVVRETFALSSTTTSLFLGRSNDCLRSRPTDLLLSAIAWAFCKTFPDRQVPVICLEGHGRQSTGSDDMDVSSTVGWFTTVMPVSVPSISGEEDLLQFCARTKDARSQSESQGVDVFRAQNPLTRQDLRIPEILVNFTGVQRTDTEAGGLFREDVDSNGDQYDFSDNMRRFAVFDIAVAVKDDKLAFELSYDNRISQKLRMGDWLSECKNLLDEVSNRLAASPPRPTLSDFPALPLTSDDLSVLEGKLGGLEIGLLERAGVWAESIFPATPMQSQMLRAQQANSKFWRVSTLIEISSGDASPIDVSRLVIAWHEVVAANPALRTTLVPWAHTSGADFINIVLRGLKLGECITTTAGVDLPTLPLTEWTPGRPQHHLTLMPHGASSVLCRLEISHALVDHASMSLLLQCFAQAYENGSATRHLISYEEYALALSRECPKKHVDFWASYLMGAQTSRVTRMAETGMQSGGKIFPTLVSLSDISECLTAITKAHSITSATIFRLAWALTLRAYTGNEDVVFGFIVSGRDMSMPAIDQVVGPVLNLVACRVGSIKDDVLETLTAVQEDFFTTSPHQRQLSTYLWQQYGLKGQRLFDTVVNCRLHGAPAERREALVFKECPGSEDPYEYAVVLEIDSHGSEMTASLTCWSDLVSKESAAQLAINFRQSLMDILAAISIG
ncbi:hypothetical protein F4825DRAFT_469746 [Nemania diffusa]|nr:hypothetical protein F4825DRAFT_469746 [Nemania diffusa]